MKYPLAYPPPTTAPLPPGYTAFAARVLPPPTPAPLPGPAARPALPFPPRDSPFPAYTLSTHLTPAARPRASPTATLRSLRPPHPPVADDSGNGNGNESPAEAKSRRAQEVTALIQKMRAQRARTVEERSWVGHAGEPQLWNAVNRFVAKQPSPGGGVTLFFAHANGFPKEMWEPVLAPLLALYDNIDEILVWETANHGDSALINEASLGDTFDWADNARDVLQFLTFHRPLPHQRTAPLHLPPHAAEHPARPLIGVGHSLGGGTLARAALASPALFSALVLVDPVIILEHIGTRRTSEMARFDGLIRGALSRRSVWPSLEHARTSFLRSPFFQAWHPAVLASYLSYGLAPVPSPSSPTPTPTTPVMLKQPPYAEASLFAEPRAQAETWYLLPTLPDSIELRWVMNGKTAAEATGGEEHTRHTVWRRPRNSSNVRVAEAGHLIAQEAPERLAREIADVLVRRHGPATRGKGGKARL